MILLAEKVLNNSLLDPHYINYPIPTEGLPLFRLAVTLSHYSILVLYLGKLLGWWSSWVYGRNIFAIYLDQGASLPDWEI